MPRVLAWVLAVAAVVVAVSAATIAVTYRQASRWLVQPMPGWLVDRETGRGCSVSYGCAPDSLSAWRPARR
jgi:hypothetical protein